MARGLAPQVPALGISGCIKIDCDVAVHAIAIINIDPADITEEVVGLLLSVSLFLGLPMVTLKARHVRVALLANMLSGKLDAYAEVCVPDFVPIYGGDCKRITHNVFNWDGFKASGTIAEGSNTHTLANIAKYDEEPVMIGN